MPSCSRSASAPAGVVGIGVGQGDRHDPAARAARPPRAPGRGRVRSGRPGRSARNVRRPTRYALTGWPATPPPAGISIRTMSSADRPRRPTSPSRPGARRARISSIDVDVQQLRRASSTSAATCRARRAPSTPARRPVDARRAPTTSSPTSVASAPSGNVCREEPRVESALHDRRRDPARQWHEEIGAEAQVELLGDRRERVRRRQQPIARRRQVHARPDGPRAARRPPRTPRGWPPRARPAPRSAPGPRRAPPRPRRRSMMERASSRGSASAASTRPPGNTCMSGAKAIDAGRWVSSTSSPAGPRSEQHDGRGRQGRRHSGHPRSMSRTFGLLGVPSSAGARTPGQEKGPAALRAAGLLELLDANGLEVRDHGDLPLFRWRPDPATPHPAEPCGGRVCRLGGRRVDRRGGPSRRHPARRRWRLHDHRRRDRGDAASRTRSEPALRRRRCRSLRARDATRRPHGLDGRGAPPGRAGCRSRAGRPRPHDTDARARARSCSSVRARCPCGRRRIPGMSRGSCSPGTTSAATRSRSSPVALSKQPLRLAPQSSATAVRSSCISMSTCLDFLDCPLADQPEDRGLLLDEAMECLAVFAGSSRFGGLVDHRDQPRPRGLRWARR